MKILHVYKSYYPETTGGVEKFIESLAAGTRYSGLEHHLLTTTAQNERTQNFDGLTVHYFKQNLNLASTPISLSLLKKYRLLVKSFDLIHYHFPWPFADILNLTIDHSKPTLVSYHSDVVKQKWLNYLYKPLMKHFLNRASYIVVASENYANTSQVIKNYREKTRIIPYGISENQYPKVKPETLARMEKKYGRNFFLSVGVLRYYKGLQYLILAAKNQDFSVVIAGSGPEEGNLKKICLDQKISNVKFAGFVSEEEKLALIQLSRAVVSAAHLRSEAYCIALVEGLMSGKPLVSTQIGTGTSFVNQNKITGLVVPAADPKALTQVMREIHQNDAVYQMFSQAAMKRFKEIFQLDPMCEQYISLYKSCLNKIV